MHPAAHIPASAVAAAAAVGMGSVGFADIDYHRRRTAVADVAVEAAGRMSAVQRDFVARRALGFDSDGTHTAVAAAVAAGPKRAGRQM